MRSNLLDPKTGMRLPPHLRPMTPGQKRVLEAIRKLSVKGYPPTLRELCSELGVASVNGIAEHLNALKSRGKVKWSRYSSRTLVIT